MTRDIRTTLFVAAFAAFAALGTAQEIGYLDLTGVQPRLALRFPSTPPAKCNKTGACAAEGVSGMSVACGGTTPGGLRINLTYLDRAEYFDGDTAEIETTIQNVGKTTIQIPWTPHLADLQPPDEGSTFAVYELKVGLFLNWGETYSTSLGWLDLYGDPTQAGTMVTLNPGERLRIRGEIKIFGTHADGIQLPALELAQRASARTLFRVVEYAPHRGGLSERISNVGPREVAGTDQPIHLLAALNNN